MKCGESCIHNNNKNACICVYVSTTMSEDQINDEIEVGDARMLATTFYLGLGLET